MLLYSRVTRTVHYSTLPPVRMSDVADDDSGIGNETEESENSSTGSDNTSTGSGSDSSPNMEPKPKNESGEPQRLDTVPLGPTSGTMTSQGTHCTNESAPPQVYVAIPLVETEGDIRDLTVANRLTAIIQVAMIHLIARPVLFPHFVSKRISNGCLKLIAKCTFVWLFVVVAIFSITGTALLQPTNRPPQFFDPDSNIQKLLDLKGNLTDARSYNCWACSAWYTKYGGTSSCLLLKISKSTLDPKPTLFKISPPSKISPLLNTLEAHAPVFICMYRSHSSSWNGQR